LSDIHSARLVPYQPTATADAVGSLGLD
jgi:hypothetical protein